VEEQDVSQELLISPGMLASSWRRFNIEIIFRESFASMKEEFVMISTMVATSLWRMGEKVSVPATTCYNYN
jgi:hypothetical protein